MLRTAFTILSWDFASPFLWVPLALWLLMMVFAPIAQWFWGSPGILILTNLGVVAHAAASLSILLKQWRWKKLLTTLLTILPLAWLVEFIGHTTGLPFGAYKYTDLLQPQLGGVPLLIPLAWLMMLPPAWAVAARLVPPRRRLLFACAAGLAFTAWDFYLDPQMVANNLWVWLQPGAYFGIPLLNFAGWFLASTAITYITAPSDLPQRPLGVIYTLTWLFQLVGLGVFWDQPWPALCGFLAMGFFSVRFWRQEQWN
jgi:putative membrane protein